jgi:hypothetical protein
MAGQDRQLTEALQLLQRVKGGVMEKCYLEGLILLKLKQYEHVAAVCEAYPDQPSFQNLRLKCVVEQSLVSEIPGLLAQLKGHLFEDTLMDLATITSLSHLP